MLRFYVSNQCNCQDVSSGCLKCVEAESKDMYFWCPCGSIHCVLQGGRAKQPKLDCGLPGQDGAEHPAPDVPASEKALAPSVSTLPQHKNQEVGDHLAVMLDNKLALPGGQSADSVPPPVSQSPSISLPSAALQPGSVNDALAPSSGFNNCRLTDEIPPLMGDPRLTSESESLGNAPCLETSLPANHDPQERMNAGQKEGPSCAAVRGKPPATPITDHEARPHKEVVKVAGDSTQGYGKELVPDQGCEGHNLLGNNPEGSEVQLVSPAPARSPRVLPVFDAAPFGTAGDLTCGHPEQLSVLLSGDQPEEAAHTMDIVSLGDLGGSPQPLPGQPVEKQLSSTTRLCSQMPPTALSCSPAHGMRAEKSSAPQLENIVSSDNAVAADDHGQRPPVTPDLGSTVSPAAFVVVGSDGAPTKPHKGEGMPSPGHAALRVLDTAYSAIHALDVSISNTRAGEEEAEQSLQTSGQGETSATSAMAESPLLLAGGNPANQSTLGDFQPLDLAMSTMPGEEDEAAQSLILLQATGDREAAMVAGAEALLVLAEGTDVPGGSLLALATIASDAGACRGVNTDKGLNRRGERPIHATRARTMQKRRATATLGPSPMSALQVPVQLLVDKRRCQPPGSASRLPMLASSATAKAQARRHGEGESMDLLASPRPAGQIAGKKRKRPRQEEGSDGSQPSDHNVQAASVPLEPAAQTAGNLCKRSRQEGGSNGTQPSDHTVQAPSGGTNPLLSGPIVTSPSGGSNPLCALADDRGDTNVESTIPGGTGQRGCGEIDSRVRGHLAKRQKHLSQSARLTQYTASSPKNNSMANAGGMLAGQLSSPLDDDTGFVVRVEAETQREQVVPEDAKGLPCHSLAGEPIPVPVEVEPPEGGVVVPVSIEAGIARSNEAPAKQTFPKSAVSDKLGCDELPSRHPLFALHAPQSVSGSRLFTHKPRSGLQVSRGALFARRGVPVPQSGAIKGLQIRPSPGVHVLQDSPAPASLTRVKLVQKTSKHHSPVQLNVSRLASAPEDQQAKCSAADGLQCGKALVKASSTVL